MYQAGAEVTGQLRSPRDSALAGLNDLAGRVVQAGLATGGEAYMTLAPPYEPADATVGVLLHHRLSVLRYHRADAHAANLRSWPYSASESARTRLRDRTLTA